MLGYVIFITVLAVFAHNGLLLFWFDKDVSIYGRVSRLNKWILDLHAFAFWGVTVGAAFLAAFICKTLGVVGLFVGIAATVLVLKDLATINKARKA